MSGGGPMGAAPQTFGSVDSFFAANSTPQAPEAQQAPQQMGISPFVQQQMMQRQSPQQVSGLQAALMQMLGQYNQPMMRPQMQQYQGMPQYQNPALMYRPDIAGTQQNLSRVAKSVVLQQREAAEAEAARLRAEAENIGNDDAEFQAWQRQQYENSRNNSGGG